MTIFFKFLLVLSTYPAAFKSACVYERYLDSTIICTRVTENQINEEVPLILSKNYYSSSRKLEIIDIDLNPLDLKLEIRQKITYLKIVNNNISMTRNSFDNYFNLNSLAITGGNMTYLEEFSVAKSNLRSLTMTQNNISTIGRQCVFSTGLKQIVINRNNIRVINENTFEHCSNLEELDLSYNLLSTLPEGLSSCLKLAKLSIGYNRITQLNMIVLKSNHFLKTLNINNNNITKLIKSPVYKTNSLTALNLSNNPLESIEPEAFTGCTLLGLLDLRATKLKTISTKSFTGLNNVKVFLLSNIDFGNNNHPFDSLHQLQEITLENFYGLAILNSNLLENNQQLQQLKLLSSNITEIENGFFNKFKKMDKVLVTHNLLTNLKCNMSYSNVKINHLDFSHNKINKIEVCTFKFFNNLYQLILNNNNLSYIIKGTFSPLNKLQLLNISYNNFHYIDDFTFLSINYLKRLDLSQNELSDVNLESIVSHFQSLTYVGISGNKWSCNRLIEVIKYFSKRKINCTPYTNPMYDVENINGIHCINDEFETLNDNILPGNQSSDLNLTNLERLFKLTNYVLHSSNKAKINMSQELELVNDNVKKLYLFSKETVYILKHIFLFMVIFTFIFFCWKILNYLIRKYSNRITKNRSENTPVLFVNDEFN